MTGRRRSLDAASSPPDLGIWAGRAVAGLQRDAGFIRAQGARCGRESTWRTRGRKASTAPPWKGEARSRPGGGGSRWRRRGGVDARSPVPDAPDRRHPRRWLTPSAGGGARAAGFRCRDPPAHGASSTIPVAAHNHRTDEHGGLRQPHASAETGLQGGAEVCRPSPAFVRLSSTDWAEEAGAPRTRGAGPPPVERGVDLIDCSRHRPRPPPGPGYQVLLSQRIIHDAYAHRGRRIHHRTGSGDQIIRNSIPTRSRWARMLRDPTGAAAARVLGATSVAQPASARVTGPYATRPAASAVCHLPGGSVLPAAGTPRSRCSSAGIDVPPDQTAAPRRSTRLPETRPPAPPRHASLIHDPLSCPGCVPT
jgi:hypothetical protein